MSASRKLALLLAGCASLILEVVLMRVATRFTGEGALATTTTLSLFLLGLSLPPIWLARSHSNLCQKPFVLPSLTALLALFCLLPAHLRPGASSADWLLVAILILIPALACGFILPLSASPKVSQNNLSYMLFNIGAALGTAVAGLVLLPQLGLTGTTYCLSGLFAVVCLLCTTAPAQAVEVTDNSRSPADIVIFVAASSALCLLTESILIRIITTLVGSSVTALAVVASIFIAGLAVGNGLVVCWQKNVKDSASTKSILSYLALLIVLDLTIITASISHLPDFYLWLRSLITGSTIALIVPSLIISLILCLPIAILFGCVFPTANTLPGTGNYARLLGITTLSSVLAPWLYWLALTYQIFAIDQSVLLGLIKLCLIASALLFFVFARDLRKNPLNKLLWIAPLLMVAYSYLPSTTLQKQALTTGPIFLPQDSPWSTLLDFERHHHNLCFYGDGLLDSVGLFKDPDLNQYILVSSGKIEAVKSGIPIAAQYTHLLLALLPASVRANPQAMVIGMGLNITVDTLCQRPAKSVTVVEIEKQIVSANKYLWDQTMSKPQKTGQKPQIVVSDGRRYLASHDTRYDIIICQPSEPWVNGSGSLFTQEFLQLTRSRLHPDGVFAQWLQLYGLEQKSLVAYLRLFRETYPDCTIFHQSGAGEIIILGCNNASPINTLANRLLKGYEQSPDQRLFAFAGIKNKKDMADAIISATQLDGLSAQKSDNKKTISTDDNLALQYQAYLPDWGTNVTERTIKSNILLLDALRTSYTTLR